MARTVSEAFEEFMTNSVNLDPDIVKKARASKDNLLENIHEFSNDNFFNLCSDFDIQFGSFSRKTKCRELDDIDLMIGLSADGATYLAIEGWDKVKIFSSRTNTEQQKCTNNDGTLNSKLVLNHFKSRLEKLSDYSRSELHRDGEAINLNLKSRVWAFDIVPCFHTVKDENGNSYYIIPNTQGDWKLTNPLTDKQMVEYANQLMNGNFLPLVRLFKKWADYKKMPNVPSYLLETIVVNYALFEKTSKSLIINFINVLEYLSNAIFEKVNDLKLIQGDINCLSYQDRYSVAQKALSESKKANEALGYSINGAQRAAINKWREVFGEEFPTYE